MALSALAVAALGLLTERPMHPYEMFQLLIARGDDQRVKVRPGTLYHTVDRLREHGLVRATGTERAGNRPERTTYEITQDGRAELQQWVRSAIAVPQNEFPTFRVAVAEMHNLPAAEAIALMERRIAQLRGDEATMTEALTRTAARTVPERFVMDLDYERATLAAERTWLEHLIRRIRERDIDWPDPTGPASSTEGTPAS